jgi:hypothetical protein
MDKFYVRTNTLSDNSKTFDVMFGSEVVFYAPDEDTAEHCAFALNATVYEYTEFA